MPVARRRYDITPAEMLDLARSAVDAVVAELHARTEELLPDQLNRLEEVSASLARTVSEVAESSYRSQIDTVRAGLDAVRDDISAGMAEHDARLVQAVENRLAGYDPAELGRRLPPAVASAVLDGLEHSLPTIDKGLHELRELVGELVERGKRTDLARQRSLDRLDEVLVELRTGLTESVTRQHAVLLEVLDQKLSELQLTELAATLPARIGSVISDAVQRSHDLQAESLHDLATGLGRSLDAGLDRQRSATAELSATAERMASSVAGFSEVAEEAVALAFERAQASQAQRLNTMMGSLREAQQEIATELRSAIEGAVQDLRISQQEQASELAELLERRIGQRFESVVAPQYEALSETTRQLNDVVTGQAEGIVARLDGVTEELERLNEEGASRASAHETALAAAVEQFDRIGVHLETQSAAHQEVFTSAVESLRAEVESRASAQELALAGATKDLVAHLSELMDSLPERLSTDVATVLDESRSRQERIETLVAELAWVLGEQRAGTAALRDDLGRALEALPDAIASLNQAALRSEARITDLLARKLPGPDAR
ncbi:MAG: hypothetical protein KY395_01700 [Actinobacteria bacterium]|nr:hypothetical protein [Actinomycetota bacterium]